MVVGGCGRLSGVVEGCGGLCRVVLKAVLLNGLVRILTTPPKTPQPSATPHNPPQPSTTPQSPPQAPTTPHSPPQPSTRAHTWEPDTIILWSAEKATVLTGAVCPSKVLSRCPSSLSQTFTVASIEADAIRRPSPATATLFTALLCPRSTVSSSVAAAPVRSAPVRSAKSRTAPLTSAPRRSAFLRLLLKKLAQCSVAPGQCTPCRSMPAKDTRAAFSRLMLLAAHCAASGSGGPRDPTTYCCSLLYTECRPSRS